jgi:hypothetical protein
MISGRDIVRLTVLALTLVLSPPVHAERDVASGDWSLPTLMGRLAETRSGTARFVERRVMQLVATPLQSSGVLRYTAPDRLEKQTLLPRPGRLTLAGDRVTIEREGESTQTIGLQDYPEVGALVAGLRATMAGDLATLELYYVVTLEGNAGDWSLRLRPKAERARKLVRDIRIAGQGGMLTRIDTEESDGDRSEMTIMPDGS